MANELFTVVPRQVGDLLSDVMSGRLGLPDLQRPFVWKDKKVRELLDSMLKGFPIGFVLLWESPVDYENKSQIGDNTKNFATPKDLVIDGQQRLTALLAAIKGVKIVDADYKERNIKISYNPLRSEFEVWSQAYEKSAEWISSINLVFDAKENNTIPTLRRNFIKGVNEKRKKDGLSELSDDDELKIENNINALLNLTSYSLPSLEIKAVAKEEDVADIFVRVNSGGQKLTEKNFIETLLAVYDNELHKQINDFCRLARIPADGTSYNHIIDVDPVHIIRAAVGVSFHRARLKYAYMLLRGCDLNTGKYDIDTQIKNLTDFREAIQIVLNLNHWHGFLNVIADAGYLKDSLISSENAVVFSYIFYLVGKVEYKVSPVVINNLIKRWFFVTTVTGYFTDSPESAVEKIFADLRNVSTADGYVEYFNKEMDSLFTDDYFRVNLVKDLETSSTGSPVWRAYLASMNVLGYPMLFSNTPLSKYFTVGAHGTKSSIDIHHIFPKHYLQSLGIKDDRDRNQIANYAYIDYTSNIDISDNPPADYVENYRKKLGEDDYREACRQNALPENFESLNYFDFLKARRVLMAGMIKDAYIKLSK